MRGRRRGRHFGLSNLGGLLSVGRDRDYTGLRCNDDSESAPKASDGEVHVRLSKDAGDMVGEYDQEDQDQMLGDSSKEE